VRSSSIHESSDASESYRISRDGHLGRNISSILHAIEVVSIFEDGRQVGTILDSASQAHLEGLILSIKDRLLHVLIELFFN